MIKRGSTICKHSKEPYDCAECTEENAVIRAAEFRRSKGYLDTTLMSGVWIDRLLAEYESHLFSLFKACVELGARSAGTMTMDELRIDGARTWKEAYERAESETRGKCKECGARYSTEWIGTTCCRCDGTIVSVDEEQKK